LPDTSKEIFRQLNINDYNSEYVNTNVYETITPAPLFARIDKELKLKEIEESKEN